MGRGNKPLRVVLDTNVLFSAVAFRKNSPPAILLKLARAHKFDVILSRSILDELQRTLKQKVFWDEDTLQKLRKRLRLAFTILEPRVRIHAIKRVEADNRILECAVEGKAHVLVTGDFRDIRPLGHFQGIEILTPREFLQKYFSSVKG